MKSKLILCRALVLCSGLFCHFAAAQVPGKTASPAAKEAYVAAQLAKLFAGAPVHVALRGAFYNRLDVDVSTLRANEMETNKSATLPNVFLFAFDNEAAAQDGIQSELSPFKSPTTLTKAGYDEFYSGKGGQMIEMIGRRGAVVMELLSNQPKRFDAIFGAIATNLSAHPTMLSNLVHYARTMQFGDPTPLRAILSKLNAKVPGLSAAIFPVNQPWGANSVTVTYSKSNDYKLTITAKAYDSVQAAREGQESDSRMISVAADRTDVVKGIKVHEYTHYGEIYFQTGTYTFRLTYYGRGALPFLLKVGSALIGEVNQANSQNGIWTMSR